MDMSTEIIKIKARWEAFNPDFLERYGRQQALKSKIFRGEKAAPLVEGIEKFADATILELQSLLRLERDEFRRRLGPTPSCDRIAA